MEVTIDTSPDFVERLKSEGRVPKPRAAAYRYKEVWQRAVVKIRARQTVSRMSKDLQLFGVSTLAEDKSNDITQSEDLMKQAQDKGLVPIEQQRHSILIFRPNTLPLCVWSSLYLVLMLYTALIMPFRMAYYNTAEQEGWLTLEIAINAVFALDILVTLNTGYFDAEGTVVMDRRAIVKNYVTSWLAVDLLACLPFAIYHYSICSALRLVRLLRLYRLLYFARVFSTMGPFRSRLISRLQEFVSFKLSSVRALLVAVVFVLSLHLMSCLWFFVARLEEPARETWVVRGNLQDCAVREQYVNSLYWAMATLATVGYGDIIPVSETEKIVTLVWMLLGVCFFSFAVSYLTNLLGQLNVKDAVLNDKLSAIEEFSEEAHLSGDLRFRLRHAIRFSTLHTSFAGQIKRGLFSELPRALRFEVAMSMHQGAIKEIPFFAERDQAFVAAVAPFLNTLRVEPSTPIYSENDYADEVYFIWKGACAVMYEHLAMKKLHKGAYFGEIEVIYMCPRKNTVQAMLRSDLLFMNKKVLTLIQTEFSAVYEELKEIASLRNQLYEKSRLRFQSLFKSRPASPAKRRKALTSAPTKCSPSSVEDRVSALEGKIDQVITMLTALSEEHQSAKTSCT